MHRCILLISKFGSSDRKLCSAFLTALQSIIQIGSFGRYKLETIVSAKQWDNFSKKTTKKQKTL